MSSIHRDFKKFLLCFRDMCWIGNMGHVAGGWWLHSVEVFPLVFLTSSSRTLISYRFHQVFFGSFLDIGDEEDIPKSSLPRSRTLGSYRFNQVFWVDFWISDMRKTLRGQFFIGDGSTTSKL